MTLKCFKEELREEEGRELLIHIAVSLIRSSGGGSLVFELRCESNFCTILTKYGRHAKL